MLECLNDSFAGLSPRSRFRHTAYYRTTTACIMWARVVRQAPLTCNPACQAAYVHSVTLHKPTAGTFAASSSPAAAAVTVVSTPPNA
mmetsp:Transcript_30184/g.66946  ORF Transcript_30184/g.66946 Transcript_30184/m.66946 type:complete len:87 (-) Transcript_30184:1938-2198(-)